MAADIRCSVKELLPKTFLIEGKPTLHIWHESLLLDDIELYRRVIALILSIQKYKFSGVDTVDEGYCFSRIALDDLVALKNNINFSGKINLISYIKFIATQIPLKISVINKRQTEAYNWIAYALCDDLSASQEKSLYLNTIIDFLTDDMCQPMLNYGIVAQWLGDFYNMARSLAAIPNAGDHLFQLSSAIGSSAFKSGSIEESFWCWMNTACWGANYNHPHTTQVVGNIEAMISDERVPSSNKADLIYGLINITSHFSTKSDCEWAKIALEEHQEYMKGHQKLAALICISREALPESLDKYSQILILEIDSQINRNDLSDLPKIEQIRLADRLTEMLLPYIGTCIEYGKAELAVKILLHWYNVSSDFGISKKNSLVLYPSNRDMFLAGVDNTRVVLNRDLIPMYKALTKVSNEFLRIASSINTVANFEIAIHEPDRFGVPDESKSEEVERLLKIFFHCEELKDFLSQSSLEIETILCLPSNHHSLQYILSKYVGDVWPIASSLEKPKLDPDIKNVCLWCGAGSFTETIESSVLLKVFESVGIHVDHFSSEKTTKEDFIQIYTSDKYDVIWVMSHGEFDHWNQGNLSIGVGAGESITLDEVMNLEVIHNDHRRLLMLNVCDGATHANLDGLAKLGFAPALTSRYQCTISHLWPINSHVAATFGAIYAEKLSKCSDFFQAFKETLIVMREPTERVVSYLRDNVIDSFDIQERLNNNPINLELMIHGGSSAFFE